MLESADHSELRMGQGAGRYPLPEMNKQDESHIRCQNKNLSAITKSVIIEQMST